MPCYIYTTPLPQNTKQRLKKLGRLNKEGITLKTGKYLAIYIKQKGIAVKEEMMTIVIKEQIIMVNLWDRERTAKDKHVGKEVKK